MIRTGVPAGDGGSGVRRSSSRSTRGCRYGSDVGQFFEELAVPLDASCVDEFCTDVAVYVNGDLQSGNPADIPLTDLQQVSIVIGTPPAEIPDSFSGEP